MDTHSSEISILTYVNMALLDIRNIPFEIALKLTDDEIIAIENSSTSYANYESIVAKNNANVEVASKYFSNISFADALKMTDAEIIALETGIFPPPPTFQKSDNILYTRFSINSNHSLNKLPN